jgi:hypothetical protein
VLASESRSLVESRGSPPPLRKIFPAAESNPATVVIRNNGPRRWSAAAEVKSFWFDAGVKRSCALRSYRTMLSESETILTAALAGGKRESTRSASILLPSAAAE